VASHVGVTPSFMPAGGPVAGSGAPRGQPNHRRNVPPCGSCLANPDGAAAEAYCQAIRRGSRDRSSGRRMTEAASRLRKGATVNPHHNLGRRKESQVFVSRPLPAAALALAMAVAAALVGQALAGDDPFGALSVYRQPWFALPSWGWVVVGIVYYLAMMFVVFRLLRRLPTASIVLGVVVGRNDRERGLECSGVRPPGTRLGCRRTHSLRITGVGWRLSRPAARSGRDVGPRRVRGLGDRLRHPVDVGGGGYELSVLHPE
jgi:hypothetical protein